MKLIELYLFMGIPAHGRLLATSGNSFLDGVSRQTASQVWPWSDSSSAAEEENTQEDTAWTAPGSPASNDFTVVDAPPEEGSQDIGWWGAPGADDSSVAKPSAGESAGDSKAPSSSPASSWNPLRALTGEGDAGAGGHQEDDGAGSWPKTNVTGVDMPWGGDHGGDWPQLKWPGASPTTVAPSTTTGTTITSTTRKPPWKIPEEDHTQDRLHAECKEPKEYKRTFDRLRGGIRPGEDLLLPHRPAGCRGHQVPLHRGECTDAHPCWKSMEKKYCPMYLKAYQKEAPPDGAPTEGCQGREGAELQGSTAQVTWHGRRLERPAPRQDSRSTRRHTWDVRSDRGHSVQVLLRASRTDSLALCIPRGIPRRCSRQPRPRCLQALPCRWRPGPRRPCPCRCRRTPRRRRARSARRAQGPPRTQRPPRRPPTCPRPARPPRARRRRRSRSAQPRPLRHQPRRRPPCGRGAAGRSTREPAAGGVGRSSL
ncbi:unnamed protein product [Prorocentrum cordatum]|uniref:Uncharacterized protein n=1 Tax=Prorocentrum cordatum TaxID=2364126 RepID=A0ABN9VZR7_9DINO|nr:unnamed protein product [Polarella glacialis]